MGEGKGILLRLCAMKTLEEDTRSFPCSVILGLDPRIQTQALRMPDQGQTSDFAREGLGEAVAHGTVPLSWKI
ncbi:hypothetical protein ASE36_17560 [Rhizobium sp. Root274]|nr:hypothetical protein ASC71_17590 [Rhizobium sp. Root1240]KRD27656.1 hypothetical protein ASE36_17560 [Rhizobium sp. Root274]